MTIALYKNRDCPNCKSKKEPEIIIRNLKCIFKCTKCEHKRILFTIEVEPMKNKFYTFVTVCSSNIKDIKYEDRTGKD